MLVVGLLRIEELWFHTEIVRVSFFGGDHEIGVLVLGVRADEEILVLILLELLALSRTCGYIRQRKPSIVAAAMPCIASSSMPEGIVEDHSSRMFRHGASFGHYDLAETFHAGSPQAEYHGPQPLVDLDLYWLHSELCPDQWNSF